MAAGDGLISMKPTSITHAGTSASINADGGVDFTSATDLSLNGVFASGFDNYLMVIRWSSTSAGNVAVKLRASGTDATGSNYTRQYLTADSTTVSGARQTSQTYATHGFTSTGESGVHIYVYGSYLAQPTALRSVCIGSYLGAYLQDDACTHSLSTSYDGITIYPASNSITGALTIYGLSQ